MTSNARPPLILPEYGRHIQDMVEQTLLIPEREERNRLARLIVATMRRICPGVGNTEEVQRKLWEHLYLMSSGRLDIDWPYPVSPEVLTPERPKRPAYSTADIKFRHYGRLLTEWVRQIADLPEGEEREQSLRQAVAVMRRALWVHNRNNATPERIAADLSALSEGRLSVSPDTISFSDTPNPTRRPPVFNGRNNNRNANNRNAAGNRNRNNNRNAGQGNGNNPNHRRPPVRNNPNSGGNPNANRSRH